jgi:hypothetical protein
MSKSAFTRAGSVTESERPIHSFGGEMPSQLNVATAASLDVDRATAKECSRGAEEFLRVFGNERRREWASL